MNNIFATANAKATPIPTAAPNSLRFIKRSGYQLMDGASVFRFASLNTPNLILVQDRPSTNGMWVPPTLWEQLDATATLAGLGGRVTRTYTLGIGYKQHVTALRTYYEPAFVAMDNAIAAAAKYGIRLIIPILNNNKGKLK